MHNPTRTWNSFELYIHTHISRTTPDVQITHTHTFYHDHTTCTNLSIHHNNRFAYCIWSKIKQRGTVDGTYFSHISIRFRSEYACARVYTNCIKFLIYYIFSTTVTWTLYILVPGILLFLCVLCMCVYVCGLTDCVCCSDQTNILLHICCKRTAGSY